MEELGIEYYIHNELSLEEQKIALAFVDYLINNKLSFYKDNCGGWKNKTYYWV